MRRFLDTLYRLSGALAASFIALICFTVVLQVGANVIDKLTGWLTGTPLGLIVPSYAEFTGFFLAAATFFALAYTLREGGHIRVTLLVSHLEGRARYWVEIWCLGAATALTGYFTFYTINLVYESYIFNDLAVGMVPLPIWIPQLAMAAGLVVLVVALIDDLQNVLRGRPASYAVDDDSTDTPDDTISSSVG